MEKLQYFSTTFAFFVIIIFFYKIDARIVACVVKFFFDVANADAVNIFCWCR